MSIQVWTQPGRMRGGSAISLPVWPSAQSPRSPGTPGLDQWGVLPMPKSALGTAGHVLSGTRGRALTGWVRNVFISTLSSEQIPFYSNLWPVPLEPWSAPPAPPAPLPSGFVSLSLCNPCPDCCLHRDSISCLCFLSPLGPWLPLKAFSGPFKPAVPGAGEAGRA